MIVFGSLLFAACKKQLDIQPRQSIDFNTALTNSTGIEAAIAGIYGSLRDQTQYGRDKLALSDALSDITLATGKSGRLQPENRNTLNAHFAAWTSSYYYINQINLVLDAIPNISDATSATKDRWEGEMKFLRALLFQDLAKIYAYDTTAIIPSQYKGNVVLSLTGIKTADQAQNSRLPRASTKSVYDAIYADLNTAIAKLGNNPRNVSGGAQVYYANKAAAHALLCRAALHYGDWATVITQATNALSNASGVDASLQTAANYVAGWRSTRNPESLFEVRFAIQNENLGVNVSLQTSYTTLAALGAPTGATGGFGDLVPNNFLLSQLGITSSGYPNITRGPDVRAQLYEWGTAGRGTRFIECTKFFGKSGFPNLDNVPVLRIPELYLNRAEAYYRSGNQPLALADLNTILTKRGLASVSLSDTALLNEILRQKMLEYAFEGYRWFDLKRNGMDVNKTYIGLALIPFNDKRILPPIPRSEIDGNPNIQQNPGY
ncbi:MAG: RagB/SusD family nutrient uptake outer membrane protein [Chitinophagaceae bacterium]